MRAWHGIRSQHAGSGSAKARTAPRLPRAKLLTPARRRAASPRQHAAAAAAVPAWRRRPTPAQTRRVSCCSLCPCAAQPLPAPCSRSARRRADGRGAAGSPAAATRGSAGRPAQHRTHSPSRCSQSAQNPPPRLQLRAQACAAACVPPQRAQPATLAASCGRSVDNERTKARKGAVTQHSPQPRGAKRRDARAAWRPARGLARSRQRKRRRAADGHATSALATFWCSPTRCTPRFAHTAARSQRSQRPPRARAFAAPAACADAAFGCAAMHPPPNATIADVSDSAREARASRPSRCALPRHRCVAARPGAGSNPISVPIR